MWHRLLRVTSVWAVVLSCPAAACADAYDAPLSYYNTATATAAATLRGQLKTIISSNSVNDAGQTVTFRSITYGNVANAIDTLDQHPTISGSVLLIYNRDDALKGDIQSSGVNGWNREHIWPASKLGGSGAAGYSDEHNLRPSQPALNNTRDNLAFGGTNDVASIQTTGPNSGQFSPGAADRGDVARTVFYMATRYYTGTGTLGPTNLNVVNVATPEANTYQMGDLASLLRYHYQDLPDTFERRRNSLVYSGLGTLSQGNRNPYVDRPELVWAVFGDGANDSQISVAPATAGASTKAVSFGRVIVGSATPSLSTTVALNKAGADPTTFSVSTGGAATSDTTGRYNAFIGGVGNRNLTVGLTGVTTATPGLKSGTVTIDNTDITNNGVGTGTGSLDGNDTIDLSLSVLDHSNASFSRTGDQDKLFLNFDAVNLGQTQTQAFSLTNLLSASGFTAGLDLDVINATGDTNVFDTTMAAFAKLNAGASADFTASFTPDSPGGFYAVYTLGVSDENIAGATSGSMLTLILSGVSAATTNAVPEPALLSVLSLGAMLLRRRRRL